MRAVALEQVLTRGPDYVQQQGGAKPYGARTIAPHSNAFGCQPGGQAGYRHIALAQGRPRHRSPAHVPLAARTQGSER
jgi:hypothetical protein